MPMPEVPTLTFTKSTSPARLEPRCDLGRIVGPEPGAVADLLVADQAHADREPVADGRAHRLQHLDAEAHAPVEIAAVLVGAEVAVRREELVDQVAVRGVDLHPVETGGRAVRGRAGEPFDHGRDLVVLDRLGRLHVVRDERRRPRGELRPRATVHAAVVRELQEGERAVLVRRTGDQLQPRDRRLVPRARVVRHLVRGRRVHRGLTADHDPGATTRELAEVPRVAQRRSSPARPESSAR